MVPFSNDIVLLSSNAKNKIAFLQVTDKIISTSYDSASIKNDTLVENRTWINCFSNNNSRDETRKI